MLAPIHVAVAAALAACTKHGPSPAKVPDSSLMIGASGDDGSSSPSAVGVADGAVASMTSGIRWIGRVEAASSASAVRFAWSGTGLVTTVSGSKISVRLQTEGPTESAFFQSVIDGAPGPRLRVGTGPAQTVTLGSGLSPGDHRVELYRETEGMYGDSIYFGFVDGTVKGAPPSNGR